MKSVAAVVLASCVVATTAAAQERDRSLERINLKLTQPSPVLDGVVPLERTVPKKLGIFTLVEPQLRGEMIRVSVPVGELVMRAVRGTAAARHRRQASAAKRRVEAELKARQQETK